jgi:hypothetical protein
MFEDVSWIISEAQLLGIRCGRRLIMGTPIYGINPRHEEGKITLIKEGFCALI